MSEAKAKYLAAKAAFEETFEKHLQNGVEFISDQVFIDPEVEIAPGAVILPGCILRGKTVIGANCVIGPNTLLQNTIVEAGSTVNASQCYDSHLGPNNKIGPFTHVRTGTVTDEACTWRLCGNQECQLCRGQHCQPSDLHWRCDVASTATLAAAP